MSAAASARARYHEVVFGPEERDRQVYIDYGDGSLISGRAEIDAARAFSRLTALGVPCGLWAGGVLTAGTDIPDEPEPEPELEARAVTPGHKTRTFAPRGETGRSDKRGRPMRERAAFAICSCGWSQCWDTREIARSAAREHRLEAALAALREALTVKEADRPPPPLPTWPSGAAG